MNTEDHHPNHDQSTNLTTPKTTTMTEQREGKMTSDPSTTTTTTSSDSTPTVAGVIAAARAGLSEGAFISRSEATDWLLDSLNASVRPPVRKVILAALGDFSQRNMAPVAEFVAALDQVQIALQVDAAFDDYELEAA